MDLRTALEAALSLAGFMSALWIRAVRSDIHELVRQVANHGERIAVLESKMDHLDGRAERIAILESRVHDLKGGQ